MRLVRATWPAGQVSALWRGCGRIAARHGPMTLFCTPRRFSAAFPAFLYLPPARVSLRLAQCCATIPRPAHDGSMPLGAFGAHRRPQRQADAVPPQGDSRGDPAGNRAMLLFQLMPLGSTFAQIVTQNSPLRKILCGTPCVSRYACSRLPLAFLAANPQAENKKNSHGARRRVADTHGETR